MFPTDSFRNILQSLQCSCKKINAAVPASDIFQSTLLVPRFV